MTSDPYAGTDAEAPAAAFSKFLGELKRRGSMLLLVGPAQHTALSRACTRLLGESTDTRRPLFVRTGSMGCAHDPAGSTPVAPAESPRTIQYRTATRSAAAAEPAADRQSGTAVDGDLDDLLSATHAEIERVRSASGGLDPAELRVCVDSLDALLATHDDERVFRFLHGLSGSVRDADAMCHVHLPTSVDAEPVETLKPVFDAVVEIRAVGRPQQRWHVPDEGFSTGWLSL